METTTIQVSRNIKNSLERFRLFGRETYNDILERILEDFKEVNEQTKKDITTSLKQIKEGKFKTHEEVRAKMGF